MASNQTSIDERFNKVDVQLVEINERMDVRFGEINKRFEEMANQLDRLAAVVVKGFDRIDRALEDKASKADLQKVYDLLDKVIKQQEISDDERLVMGHQLERLDRWVHEVAEKIGYQLTT